MAIRLPLRSRLIAAWDLVVEKDYIPQRINSERSLQVSFWSHLNASLPAQCRMFIEPRLIVENGVRVYPDIVICNSRSIICVIEIKYKPRAQAVYRSDVRKLNVISTHGQTISLSNQRFSGRTADDRQYKVANHALFVWAGFHRAPRGCSYNQLPSIASKYPQLSGHFIALHAETNAFKEPDVFHRLA